MSAFLNDSDWNFRIVDKRLVVVKTKNESIRKIAILDILTNLMFNVHVPQIISIQQLMTNQQYIFNLKVYTLKNLEGIEVDFVNFFEAIDIDQPMDDFIKAYLVYPTKIRFELVEVEEP